MDMNVRNNQTAHAGLASDNLSPSAVPLYRIVFIHAHGSRVDRVFSGIMCLFVCLSTRYPVNRFI